MDYFIARYYGNALGRFVSPDPANIGADPSDPKAWNAYAYVRNNPLAFTDPSGLSDCNVFNGTYEGSGSGFPCYDASVHYGGPTESLTSVGGPTGVASGSTIGSGSPELAAAEAEHASNFGWQATGLLYGKSYNQFFSSLNAYFDWRTDIAGLGESKAYNAYMADCAHSSAPCNGNDTVVERDQGPTGNYRLDKSALDTRSMSGMILDPLYLLPVPESLKQYFHPGASWYGWSPVDTLHVAGVSNGVESHQDLFSPIYLAPLHFLFDVVPSFFINPSPGRVVATYVCSPVGGCHQ